MERIELMRILNKALSHGHKKIIDDLEETYKDVDNSNKAIRSFVLYLCYYHLNDNSGMDSAQELLKDSNNNQYFFNKIALLKEKKEG